MEKNECSKTRFCGILDRKASTGSPAWTLGPQPTFQRWSLAKRKRVHWGWDLRLYPHFLFTVCIVTDSMWPRHQPLMPSWLPCQDGMQAINCKQKWTVPPRRWFLLDQSNENCNWYNSGCRKVSLQTGVKMVSAKKEKEKKQVSAIFQHSISTSKHKEQSVADETYQCHYHWPFFLYGNQCSF